VWFNNEFKTPADAQTTTSVTMPGKTDSENAGKVVVNFLNWYKTHMDEANRISLVNQQPGKPYSVNFKNGERYLSYLKNSNALSDSYLNEWRIYFRQRSEGFRLTRQAEGPPTGFEYDLVLLSQEVDKQISAMDSLKINKVTVSKSKATVQMTLLDSYEFRLIRHNNQWMINEILNLSQE
jgi:hypothetical protein